MSIRVTCQKCGASLKVKEDLAGTKGKCPACKGTLYVPTLEEAAQGATAPLGATETSAAASAGDTGSIKVPTKTKTSKAAAASDQPPPPPEANGSAAAHAPAAEAPPAPRMESPPPAPPAESSTDDLAEPNGEAPPKTEGKSRLKMPEAEDQAVPKDEKPKQKLRMSDTDAEDEAPPAEKPKTKAKPDEKPAGAEAAPEKAAGAKAGKDEFDLDSFLMEGPKPKAPPPVPDETAAKKGPAPRGGSGRRLSMSDDETNVPGPSETLPPPNKGRSAQESAIAALGGAGTASSAKDLLARATQEGRARAASMPDEAREGIDFKGAFKAIYQQYGLQTIGTVVLCVVLYTSMNYMMTDSPDLPPLARVYGKVTLKGAPVAGVVVNFTPVGTKDSKESQQKVKKGAPRAASAMTDQEGHFELMYMEGIRGAVVGQNRVWINPVSAENDKKVPGQWTSAGTSGDIREVKKTGGEENIELSKGK